MGLLRNGPLVKELSVKLWLRSILEMLVFRTTGFFCRYLLYEIFHIIEKHLSSYPLRDIEVRSNGNIAVYLHTWYRLEIQLNLFNQK